MDFEELMNNAKNYLSNLNDKVTYYFQNCSQNELIAWGVNGLGLVLLIVGIFLL